jgi:protein-tyrosine phosphatase
MRVDPAMNSMNWLKRWRHAGKLSDVDLQQSKGQGMSYRVLMVCMGNICRSPTAEGVLRSKLAQAGLADRVLVDSAGTHAHHIGNPPDKRSQQAASRRGYDLSNQRARKVVDRDFTQFDLLLAMDWDNLALLEDASPFDPTDPLVRGKLRRLTEFVPQDSPLAGTQTVPDPYYGGPAGFDVVLDLVEAACDGLVRHLAERVAQSGAEPHA